MFICLNLKFGCILIYIFLKFILRYISISCMFLDNTISHLTKKNWSTCIMFSLYLCKVKLILMKTKRRRSDQVLWQKPLYQQKCQRGKVATQTTPQKSFIKQQLRTDLGRSVGVTTATQQITIVIFLKRRAIHMTSFENEYKVYI